MKVIPKYKVIGPYNYDRTVHNVEKIYAEKLKKKWLGKHS